MPTHPPDHIAVFAIIGRGDVGRLANVGSPLSHGVEVVYRHIAIVEATDQHVRMSRMHVHTHDPTVGLAQPLGVGGVLQGIEADVADVLLLVEVVRAVTDGKEVAVDWVPAEASNLQILVTKVTDAEPPKRKKTSFCVFEFI